MNVLITGASGFIGQSLVKKLREAPFSDSGKTKSHSRKRIFNGIQMNFIKENPFKNLDAIIYLVGANIGKR